MTITVTFKFAAKTFSLDVEAECTIGDLKTQIESCGETELPSTGKILKEDAATLSSTGIENGHTVHIVRNGPTGAAPAVATSAAAPTTAVAPAAAAPAAAANPFAALGLGGAGGMPDLSALMGGAGGFGGFGGAGGAAGGLPQMGNIDQLSSMLQNPAMMQMMTEMVSTPGFMDMMMQQMQHDPMMQQMTQANPAIANMMRDPNLMRQMMDPSRLTQMVETTRNMQQLFGGAAGGAPAAGGAAGGAPDLSALMSAFGGAGGAAGGNPFGGMDLSSLFGGAPEDTSRAPAERYAVQLEQLSNMGFIDREANIQALTEARGDVNAAITRLIERGIGN